MSFIATAIGVGGGALIGGLAAGSVAGGLTLAGGALVGGLAGGALGYSGGSAATAEEEAADAKVQSAQDANVTIWNMYKQSRADRMPWLEAGRDVGLKGLTEGIEAGPGEFKPEEQPGYKFGFKEFVEKPYLSMRGAKGKRLSGETYKGLTKYAQDYASTSYDNFMQRYYQKLTPYQSLAGVGLTTAAGLGKEGEQTAGEVGGNIMAAGQASGAGKIGSANAYTNALQSGFDLYGTLSGGFA